MKKIFLLSFILLIAYKNSHATLHTITVSDFQFSPQSIPNVVVGDIIEWVWASGFHTTTSLTIPVGAASWDADITSSATNFQYTVTMAGTYNYQCNPHAPGMSGTFTVSSVVPVILTNFKANTDGKQTILTWTTSSEQTADYFSIRKSINGTDFIEIGRLEAAGTSTTERTYNFTDTKLTGFNRYIYYSIMIVDIDGQTKNSAVRMIKNESAAKKIISSLSPNPISKPGHLMLRFNADEDGFMDAILMDVQGKSILKLKMSASKGINNGHIHLGNIPAGTYSLTFIMNEIKEVHRIVVK